MKNLMILTIGLFLIPSLAKAVAGFETKKECKEHTFVEDGKEYACQSCDLVSRYDEWYVCKGRKRVIKSQPF